MTMQAIKHVISVDGTPVYDGGTAARMVAAAGGLTLGGARFRLSAGQNHLEPVMKMHPVAFYAREAVEALCDCIKAQRGVM